MNVILLQRIANLGQMGDKVSVRRGFACNYLLPQKMALRATELNIELFKTQRIQYEAVNLKKKEEAEKIAKKMEKLTVTLIRSASEVGQLYGSVRARDIIGFVGEKGFNLDRNQILIPVPIKVLGNHIVHVILHPEVQVDIAVRVAQSLEEAAVQEQEEADMAATALQAKDLNTQA